MAVIVILGAGMMGTAMAFPCVDNGHTVRLVGTHLDSEIIECVRETGRHPKLELSLPKQVLAYPDSGLEEALTGADAIILGVSSLGVRWAADRLAPLVHEQTPLAMVSKGLCFEEERLKTLPEVFLESLPEAARRLWFPVGIAGPCIAGELARRVPTSVIFTQWALTPCERFAELVRGPYYTVHTCDDLVAIEVCAALKNAFALGVALGSGIHAAAGGAAGSVAMHNYEAAVFAESIWEMQRFLRFLGRNPDHACGLAGVGDLNVTCNGGRTGRFGHLLGLGIGRDAAIQRMHGATLECLEILETLRSALQHFVAKGQLGAGSFPLLEHLAEIALDGARVQIRFDRFFQT